MTRFIFYIAVMIHLCCAQPELIDMDYKKKGIEFAQALKDEDFNKAHGMLTVDLKKEISQQNLEVTYKEMIAYGGGPVKRIELGDGYTDYPDKQANDLGGIYVGLIGDFFVEGILVFVCLEGEKACIREVIWGRP